MGAGGRSSRVGVFGGTFDPLHMGHLVAAQDAYEVLGLERILLIPARRSPHKRTEPRAPADSRLRMLREAVADDPRFEVLEVELHREGPSFTVDTLRELSGADPGTRHVLLLGADQWADFSRWREPREIARMADLAVMTRRGEQPAESDAGFGDGPPPPFTELSVTRLDISSTRLRRRIREGRSVRYLVPEPVRRIIEAEKLYLPDSTGS